ncbi:hypothetical protein WKT22_00019 [Candidatus Lokiarchaeum ossiferum]
MSYYNVVGLQSRLMGFKVNLKEIKKNHERDIFINPLNLLSFLLLQ